MPAKALLLSVLVAAFLSIPGFAQGETCQRFGPQAPRDISDHAGTNPVVFSSAPAADKLHLCDIHFHKHAEHRGPGFETPAGSGKFGGYRCDGAVPKDDAELKACGNVSPGDTIEAHWVYTSCDVDPGPKLDSCSSKSCGNPQLRVETQVFVVSQAGGVDFGTFEPSGEGTVSYLGSTTGYKFSAETCSPLQVTWSVPDTCMAVDFASLGRWCEPGNNPYDETHAHGIRPLVTDLELLSKIP